MRRVISPLAVLAALCVAGPVSAHEVPYGPAGCGLGAMLIGTDAGLMQTSAGTTNGSFYNNVFGITSGTLGCGVNGGEQSAKAFIESNREAVAKDIARGSGETLEGLATIAGCADPSAVGTTLQSQFGEIFPDAGVTDAMVSDAIVDALKADTALQCAQLKEADHA